MNGVTGFYLHVDLTASKVKKKHVPESVYKNLLGGNGLAMYLLSKFGKPKLNALDVKAPLVFVTGPLTGSGVPGSGLVGCYAKSPLTGFLGEAWCGSSFGVELKHCGFDALVITGKPRFPVELIVDGENVVLKKSELWGEDAYSTADQLNRKYEGASVACIGLAGENGVAFASIRSGLDSFSRFGLGAVMGSKKVKAIVVKGNKRVEVSDSLSVRDLILGHVKALKESELFESHSKFGTGVLLDRLVEEGVLPVENFNKNLLKDWKGLSPSKTFKSRTKRLLACHSCGVPCRRVFRTKAATLKGTKEVVVAGLSFDSLFALGANLGITDVDDVARLKEDCDRFGLDVVSTGAVLAFAMELSTLKLIDFVFEFGNVEHASELINLIAAREGIGRVLSAGVRVASEKIGLKSVPSAIAVKGLELNGFDPRGLKGVGLSFAVSSGSEVSYHVALAELSGKVKGLKVKPLSVKDKGVAVKLVEDDLALFDCLPLCRLYDSYWLWDSLPSLLKAVTGESFSKKQLMEVGERIVNLEKLFNLKCGWKTSDDWLPGKLLTKGLTNGKVKGEHLPSSELKSMISDYYSARSWTSDGVPSERKLHVLGLDKNGF